MSISTWYTFFDGAVIDPIWRSTWTAFFRDHPTARRKISQLIDEDQVEISAELIAKRFATETLARTVRRSYSPLFLMSEIMYVTPKLRRHVAHAQTGYTEDHLALVAVAIDGWVRGSVAEKTLQAVLSLHALQNPRHWLDLPRAVAGKVRQLTSAIDFEKPPYAWLGREGFRGGDFDDHGGLNVAETKRFLSFLEGAWADNPVVPFLKRLERGLSVDPADGWPPRFRQFDLTRTLVGKTKALQRFERPAVMRACDVILSLLARDHRWQTTVAEGD